MKKRVLFLCTGNSCRSQMAEGFLRNLAGDQYEVFSAGTIPGSVHPLAIRAMAELGIDISKQTSKPISEFSGQKFDYVITLCNSARMTCPVFPGKHQKLHWEITDPINAAGPEEEKMKLFRSVRDDIEKRIRRLFT